jgi:hypothetical protein
MLLRRPGVTRFALPLLILLAACAADSRWVKEGASDEAQAHDLSQCRSEARRAGDRDAAIDQDILSTRSQDLQRSGTTTLRRDTMQNSNRGRFDEILARCMAARGYRPAT